MAGLGARGAVTASTLATPVALVRSLTCPSCGAGIEQRMGGWTQSIACSSCGAILDASDPNLHILQEAERREVITPRLALGSRGTLSGVLWQVTGFQRRQIVVDGTPYHWDEYLLFNPWQGFRYLSEYAGHWNEITTIKRPPVVRTAGGRLEARLDGVTFKHFQRASAETVYVLGEFPWEIRRGDRVETDDFIAPPLLLSGERTESEQTWSRGEYRTLDEMRAAFPDAKRLEAPRGVFANQPSPVAGLGGRMWRTWGLLMVLLFALMVVTQMFSSGAQLFSARYIYDKDAVRAGTATAESGGAFVTPMFTAPGRTSNIELFIESDLDQDWMYLNIALINVATGVAREVGREVSNYYGRDSDGSWSEGSRNDRVKIGSVPSGEYYLRVEPEGGDIARIGGAPVNYSISVRRDVPSFGFFGLAFLVLLVPPIIGAARSGGFETQRWAESDYATTSSSGDDDDE